MVFAIDSPLLMEKMQDAVDVMKNRPALVAGAAGVIVGSAYLYSQHQSLPFNGPTFGVAALVNMRKHFAAGKVDQFLEEMQSQYGDFFAIQSPIANFLFILDPDTTIKVFRDAEDLLRPRAGVKVVKKVFGSNILHTNPQEWKVHRSAFLKVVTTKHTRFVQDKALAKTSTMFKRWQAERGRKFEVDLEFQLVNLMQDVGGLMMMGYDFKSVENDGGEEKEAVDNIEPLIAKRMLMPEALARMVGGSTGKAQEGLDLLREHIQKALKYKQEHPIDADKHGYDTMTAMIESGELTEEQIVGNILASYFGFRNTVSGVLGLILLLLAEHPEVMQKGREEIKRELGNEFQPLQNFEDHYKLEYVDAIVKEGLRMNPPANLLSRELRYDCMINGKKVPKGTSLMMSTRHLHFNEKYFRDAKSFKPERWLNAKEWLQPGSFVSFGSGERQCAGRRAGHTIVKSVLTMFLANYEWQLAPGEQVDIKRKLQVTLMGPVKFKFTQLH